MLAGSAKFLKIMLLVTAIVSLCFIAPGETGAVQPVKQSVQLTKEDKAWLAAHPVVNIRISRSYPPFEFFEQGHFQGIAFDYLTIIGNQLGIEFRPAPDMMWQDALESLRKRDGVDMVLMISKDQSRDWFLEFTQNYLTFPEVIITRKDSEFISGLSDLEGRTVATENGFIKASKIKNDVPAVNVMEMSSTLKALDAVSTGKADAYIGNLGVATYLIGNNGLANLKVAAPSPYPLDSYAMGVRKDWAELARIIDKTLVSIPEEELRKINQKWLSVRFDHGIRPRDIIAWVLAVSGIALVFIVQLRRMVRKRTLDLKQEIGLRKEREEQLRLYVHRLPIACILWGIDFRVQSWNPSAERIFGYSEAEALGKTADELIVPLSVREQVSSVWRRINEGESEAGSINENVTKDGTIILCEWTNTPYFDKDGNVTGVISVAQDITEWQKSRDLMIKNEKMTLVAGMAAGMAHEVNNPLGIIAQDLQNLERRFSPALPANCKTADELGLDLYLVEQYMERRDMLNYISSMRSAVKRASGIISNMLQFSRQSDAAHQLLNINEVIEQSIKLTSSDYDLRKKYDFKNVLIAREFDEHLPLVSVSSTEMVQVIINLLKNSAQAMFEAGTAKPSILISTLRNNGHVKVVIKDNGPGMSEATRQRAFDPFFTTKDIGAGTGLGLSVSYTIVTKNHGGELTVESKAGQGASFTIKLPVRAE